MLKYPTSEVKGCDGEYFARKVEYLSTMSYTGVYDSALLESGPGL